MIALVDRRSTDDDLVLDAAARGRLVIFRTGVMTPTHLFEK
jgi:hypothetical protein